MEPDKMIECPCSAASDAVKPGNFFEITFGHAVCNFVSEYPKKDYGDNNKGQNSKGYPV